MCDRVTHEERNAEIALVSRVFYDALLEAMAPEMGGMFPSLPVGIGAAGALLGQHHTNMHCTTGAMTVDYESLPHPDKTDATFGLAGSLIAWLLRGGSHPACMHAHAPVTHMPTHCAGVLQTPAACPALGTCGSLRWGSSSRRPTSPGSPSTHGWSIAPTR